MFCCAIWNFCTKPDTLNTILLTITIPSKNKQPDSFQVPWLCLSCSVSFYLDLPLSRTGSRQHPAARCQSGSLNQRISGRQPPCPHLEGPVCLGSGQAPRRAFPSPREPSEQQLPGVAISRLQTLQNTSLPEEYKMQGGEQVRFWFRILSCLTFFKSCCFIIQ